MIQDKEKKAWVSPTLEQLDLTQTLNGNFSFQFEGTKTGVGPFSPSGTTPLP